MRALFKKLPSPLQNICVLYEDLCKRVFEGVIKRKKQLESRMRAVLLPASKNFCRGPLQFLIRALGFTFAIFALLTIFSGEESYLQTIKGEAMIALPLAESANLNGGDMRYEDEYIYLSPIYKSEKTFQLLALSWAEDLPMATALDMEIRFKNTANIWTDWQHIHEDLDGAEDPERMHSYFVTEDSIAFQYRAELSSENNDLTPRLADFRFDAVSGGKDAPAKSLTRLIFKSDSPIITRQAWGANEEYRYYPKGTKPKDESPAGQDENTDGVKSELKIVKEISEENGRLLRWPQEYPEKISKIFVHHTATTSNLSNPSEAVRAIYHYHANSRAWGDIGYNYLIAPNGNVYEGRAGGAGVVAGHASGYNTGSIGIALIGNYETQPIPQEMIQSLSALIYELSQDHGIDPSGTAQFRDKKSPNIMGHQDVSATACPGDYTYELLPELRLMIASAIKNNSTKSSGAFAYESVKEMEMLGLNPQEKKKMELVLKNTGSKTWNSSTYLTVNANSESDKKVSLAKDSKKSIAKMKESSVAPGASAHFEFEAQGSLSTGGLAHFEAFPVFNGTEKSSFKTDLAFFVEQPELNYTLSKKDAPSILKSGQSANVTYILKNTGNVDWTGKGTNQIILKKIGSSVLSTASTVATLKEERVKPGESGTFTFSVKGSSQLGKQSLKLQVEMPSVNLKAPVQLNLSLDALRSNSDEAEIYVLEDKLFLEPNESHFAWIQIKNLSAEKWVTEGENALKINFSSEKGISVGTPKIAARSIPSGASTRVYFTIKAPEKTGEYVLQIRPQVKGSNLTKTPFELKLEVLETSEVSQEQTVQTSSLEREIRIRLTPETYIEAPIITADKSFTVYAAGKKVDTFVANSKVKLSDKGKSYELSIGSKRYSVSGDLLFTPESGGILEITNMSQRPAWNTALNDNKFRGELEIKKLDGKFELINQLPLEDYLKGLGEVSNTAHPEKIKTIMVAARSYALYYMTLDEKFPGKPWHLDDTPESSQKYLGYGLEARSPKVADGVNQTKSKVVAMNGKVLKVPYFNSSDGRTRSAEEVWGWKNTPYLTSVSDSWCKTPVVSGHMVGVSGCGATGMAEAGKTYLEILKYYLQGIDVQDL